jgi:hypothetical protein
MEIRRRPFDISRNKTVSCRKLWFSMRTVVEAKGTSAGATGTGTTVGGVNHDDINRDSSYCQRYRQTICVFFSPEVDYGFCGCIGRKTVGAQYLRRRHICIGTGWYLRWTTALDRLSAVGTIPASGLESRFHKLVLVLSFWFRELPARPRALSLILTSCSCKSTDRADITIQGGVESLKWSARYTSYPGRFYRCCMQVVLRFSIRYRCGIIQVHINRLPTYIELYVFRSGTYWVGR